MPRPVPLLPFRPLRHLFARRRRGDLRAALHAVIHRQLRPLTFGLVALYLLFALAHWFTLPPHLAPLMSAAAGATAGLLLIVAWLIRQIPSTSPRVYVVAAFCVLLVLGNTLLHLYLTGEPRQSTNVVLVLVAIGFLFISRPWYLAMTVFTLASWVGVVWLLPASPEWVHFGFAVAEAAIVSTILHVIRRHTTTRAEWLRLLELRQRRELQAAKTEAEEMARLKTAFLANMSHEIRTPLTSIIGFAEVLRDQNTAEVHHLSGLIHGSGLRLLDTINSVLDLARLEAGRLTLRPEPVAVPALVADAVALLRPLAERKGLTLEVRYEAPDVVARLDPTALSRILNNVIGNAIKFTTRGGILVTVARDEETLCLRVSDSGVGIASEFLPHLFDEFRQESIGIARAHEGSGLGLSITRRLVDTMNGSIAVASEKARGSTFEITFPCLPRGADRGDALASPATTNR